jgi:hypothetical protein
MEIGFIEVCTVPVDRPYLIFLPRDHLKEHLTFAHNSVEVNGLLREWLDANAGKYRVDWNIADTVTNEMGFLPNILVSFKDKEVAAHFKLAWV